MQKKELAQLLEKYHAGLCSDAEQATLHEWYGSLGKPLPAPDPALYDTGYLDARFADFRQRAAPSRKTGRLRRLYLAGAAAAAILVGVLVVRYANFIKHAPDHASAARSVASQPARVPAMHEKVAYDRHLVLPDSSVVLLRAGGALQLNAGFNGAERRLSLEGEAYFDVKQNAHKPFIIKTAGVYTYVLGTAFNIHADPNSGRITVTVASGRVKVEADNKQLAVLTKGQELVWTDRRPNSAVQVGTARKVAWISTGLLFENVTLETVCSRLAARYQVQFAFAGTADRSERVTITDAFNGTETLDEILEIVCTTLGYTYRINGKTVIISGS